MKHANVAFFVPHVGCPNRCSFCDQNTISGKVDIPNAKEIKSVLSHAVSQMPKEMLKNSEIAFFGGSFTAIDKALMLELLQAAQKFIGQDGFCGIRISTRPDAVNNEILGTLKKYNVTSIELGAQSMKNDILLKNMRGHTAEDVIKASELIKSFGFSLGLQMMTGLYGDDENGAVYTAQEFVKIKPDTVRIYPTVVLKGTHLEKLCLLGEYKPFDVDKTVSVCAKLLNMFEENSIKVIRVGLHDQPGLKKKFVSGAYHPALGELIMGEQMFLKALSLIKSNNLPKGDVTFLINPAYISQLIGQKKRNIIRLAEMGYNVKVCGDKSVSEKEIKLR
ncbi:MAG: radical SAM protein [Ruminococcaceae bacterium]|nr:radical SAM protein [Oscillospiraceae bacterium]